MTLELHATGEEVMRAVEAWEQFAQAGGLPGKVVFNLALALEEAGSNIVDHALLRDARQTFRVIFGETGGAYVIELRDRGPEFDPTAAPPRGTQAQTQDEVPPGGWGIPLIRRFLDDIQYRREGGENVLRLIKRPGVLEQPKPIS